MHQLPRPPPGAGSPASPTTSPYQMNYPREGSQGGHSRLNSEVPLYSETDDGSGLHEDSVVIAGPSNEARRKLDQIVQNYHTKAAIVILQSRMALPTIRGKDDTIKVNKWFQLETDDTDAFREELRLWKMCDSFNNRPPPLILETYLDTSDLSNKQSLVIVDEHGRHHDVSEALNDPKSSRSSKSSSSRHRKQRTEVVLERWMVQLKDRPAGDSSYDYGGTLPTIYKKCIVFFRSLYATTRFTPVAKFVKAIGKIPSTRGGLRVNCRIVNGENRAPSSFDSLTVPLFNSDGEVTSKFFLGETESPAGILSAEVCYRNDCNFRVEDSETLLSERFMGAEDYFQPTLGSREDDRRETRTTELGSLPAHRRFMEEVEARQTYGSLSTFHGEAPPLGTSPMSALRAAKNMGSAPYSPPVESSAYSRPAQTQRPSSRALESIAMARRPSVSFNPFKAGSLSGSSLPSSSAPHGEMLPPASPHSLTRNSGMSALTQPRNRSSLTAGMPASLRGVPTVPDNITSSSSSPKPAPIRYSSSFSHRRGRLSYGGTSRADDDQGSSGKQSLSSSAQPGSGILAEAGASSGSLQTDDDNLSDFLKVLESNKNLSSFQTQKSNEAARRTTTQLSRFQSMRESHNVLTESLSSSMLLHRSSISSSRQLSSVPPMVAATSISTSSSPGKPVSPHTPHTPAIPSRLSANSIVEYTQPRRFRAHSRAEEARIEDISGDEEEGPGTTAIDIPTSPRPYPYHNRRSSSVSQQHRTLAVDDDLGDLPFHRSISLGADDREPPSLSDLRGFGQVSGNAPDERERVLRPAAEIESPVAGRPESVDREEPQAPRTSVGMHRPKLGGLGRGAATGSSGSLTAERGTGSGSERGQGRYSWARQQGQVQATAPGVDEGDDEYPLLFDMSELGRNGEQSRRSLEEGRGGGESGLNSRKGCSRRGW